TLLGETDQRHWFRNSGDHAVENERPFIHVEGDPGAALLEQPRDRSGAVPAVELLIMAEGQIDGPARRETMVDEILHRFENAEQRAFHVKRAAPPHETFGDLSRER